VKQTLEELKQKTATEENLVPYILQCVKAYSTLGEICKVLRGVFGEYKPQIGLSILSGAHNFLFPMVAELLKQKGAEDILVIGGGVIPEEDIASLKETCVNEVFTPGTPTSEIVEYIKQNIQK